MNPNIDACGGRPWKHPDPAFRALCTRKMGDTGACARSFMGAALARGVDGAVRGVWIAWVGRAAWRAGERRCSIMPRRATRSWCNR